MPQDSSSNSTLASDELVSISGMQQLFVDYSQLVKLEIPVFVIGGFGILAGIVTPIIGMIFCCCRFCGKCGGELKMAQASKEKGFCGLLTSFFLLLFVLFLIVGGGSLLSSYLRLKESPGHVENVIVKTIDDVVQFKDLFLRQVQGLLSNDLEALIDLVVRDLGLITQMNSTMDEITMKSAEVTATGTAVELYVNAVDSNVTSLHGTCVSNGYSYCGSMLSGVPTPYDFDLVPDLVSGLLTQLDPLLQLDTDSFASTVETEFSNIPSHINSSSYTQIEEVKVSLESVKAITNQTLQMLNNMVNGSFPSEKLTDAKSTVEETIDIADNFMQYGLYSIYGFSGIVALIITLTLIGVCCGPISTGCSISPLKRNGLSDLSGKLNMGLFLIDNPAGIQRMANLNTMFNLTDGNMTIKQVLLDCKANKALYKVLHLSSMFDINTFVDLDTIEMNCNSVK
ncbi:prominin-1-A-like [Tubulanus polymorphus]|uniref:prominin-1-A-like n=1 Tax=Tubulanus polymorphus TaxID=672921 RepID=UPI003DA3A294